MRVSKNFYNEETFDRLDKVLHITQVCSAVERAPDSRAQYLIAKRVKSFCLRHYRKANASPSRFCKQWEDDPKAFIDWVLSKYPKGDCVIMRRDQTRDFEPSNIRLDLIA